MDRTPAGAAASASQIDAIVGLPTQELEELLARYHALPPHRRLEVGCEGLLLLSLVQCEVKRRHRA